MAVELTTARVVITGASGFIGSHLVQFLKSHGNEPVSFPGDITDEQQVDSFFRDHNPDLIIHLAGIHAGSREDLETINVQGTNHVIQSAAKYGSGQIVFASSAAVYGNVLQESGAVETDECTPNTPYGESKMHAEAAVTDAAASGGIKAAIIRLGAVYGPGQTSGIVPVMMQSIQNDHVVRYDTNRPVTRQFIHVADVCSSIAALIYRDFTGIVNVASDNVYKISDLADILAPKFVFTREHQTVTTEYTDMRMSISKLRLLTGEKPVHSLRRYLLQ